MILDDRNIQNKYCCKWCGYCVNDDLENNKGICYLDIGDNIQNTENECCEKYYFDENLNRC